MYPATPVNSARMSGFPPPEDSLVSLQTWQDPGNVRWAFQHMRELIPTQAIRADPARMRALAARPQHDVLDAQVHRLDGSTATAAEVFEETWTDALLVLRDGVVVEERYVGEMTAQTPHLLMSVSKSIVGCVAGILNRKGLL